MADFPAKLKRELVPTVTFREEALVYPFTPRTLAHPGARLMRLSDFRVLAFDCYGTLIDWETGIVSALKPLTSRLARKLTRDEILEAHARHESSQQVFTPTRLYRDVLATVYKRLAEEWDVPAPWEECLAYGNSVGDWPALPDLSL